MEDLGDLAEKMQKSGNLAGNLDGHAGNLDLCIGIVSDGTTLRYMTDAERAVWHATHRLPDQLVVIVPPCPDDNQVTDFRDAEFTPTITDERDGQLGEIVG